MEASPHWKNTKREDAVFEVELKKPPFVKTATVSMLAITEL